jgi:hypothetical protein
VLAGRQCWHRRAGTLLALARIVSEVARAGGARTGWSSAIPRRRMEGPSRIGGRSLMEGWRHGLTPSVPAVGR